MVGTLLPYFLFAMLMLGFVAIDRYRRSGRFHEPPHNYSNTSGSDWTPSGGYWGGYSGSSWGSSSWGGGSWSGGSADGGSSFGGDGGCSFGGDGGGSCGGGDGGGGGGGGY
jgi:hypothetical protein